MDYQEHLMIARRPVLLQSHSWQSQLKMTILEILGSALFQQGPFHPSRSRFSLIRSQAHLRSLFTSATRIKLHCMSIVRIYMELREEFDPIANKHDRATIYIYTRHNVAITECRVHFEICVLVYCPFPCI